MEEIIWRGNINPTRGFGIVSNNLISELQKTFKVNILPVDYPGTPNANFHLDIDKKLQKKLLINCVNNYKIPLKVSNKQIFITACEGTKCSSEILSIENNINQLWVPSEHSKNGLINSGVTKKIHVVPHGIDTNLFRIKKTINIKSKKFRFLSIFRWTWRKSPETLINAFIREFKIDEAELIIKTGQKENHIYDIPVRLPRNIRIIRGTLSENELIELYLSSHVFVLPTRGEGWGLPFTEAGALNIPIIATNWGGHLDFLNTENSLLVDIEGLVSPPDIGKRKDNLFAEPSVVDLRKKMRYSFENYNECLLKSNKLFVEVTNKWTWSNASKIASELILSEL